MIDVGTLRPDLTDEGADEARATLARWQANPRAWRIFRANAGERRHNGHHPCFLFPLADEGYFRVMEAAEIALAGM
jgi:hypothetical protein